MDATGDGTCTTHTYVRSPEAVLRSFAGQGLGGFADTSQLVGNGWSAVTAVFSPGDLDGDGHNDIMYRASNGKLYMYRGDGAGHVISPSIWMGSGWQVYDQLFSPGDLDGDGHNDVVGRKANGELWMYPGTGVATAYDDWAEPAVMIGNGWNQFDYLAGIGDLDGDGNDDVLARKPDGALWIYLGNGAASGWFTTTVPIGAGWTTYDQLIAPGDMDGDGNPELIGRRTSDQALILYAGNGAASGWFKSAGLVGGGEIGYGSDILFSPGDFDGDGVGDIIARHDSYLVDAAKQTTTTTGGCSGTVVADVRYSYDGAAFGMAPNTGHVSTTENFDGTSWITTGQQTVVDKYGRTLSVADALGRTTTTSYTDNSDHRTTQMAVTDPLGNTTTTNLDPNRGVALSRTDANNHITTATYDPLGRLTSATKPGNTSGTPDAEYQYVLGQGVASHVRTKTLGPNGNQIVSYQILDAFLRPRQAQTTAPDGKRVISDTQYDARGNVVKVSSFYNGASGPGSALLAFADADVDRQSRATFDGRGRQLTAETWSQDALKWKTTTTYAWNGTTTVAPDGGTSTQSIVDDHGNVVEKRQYHGTDVNGAYDAASYGYDVLDRLVAVTGPAGAQWSYTYNLLGQQTSSTDPDKGTTTTTYDHAGQVTSTTDARDVTVAYTYDDGGRRTSVWQDAVGTGTKLAEWTYDSLALGQLTSATRYDNGHAYTTEVTGYDEAYRPLGTSVTLPAAEGALAGTWTTSKTYKVDGSVATTTVPAGGGLAAETVTHSYDATGHPVSLTSPEGTYVADTSFDPWGQVYQQLLGESGSTVRLTTTRDAATARVDSASVETEDPGTPGTFDPQHTNTYTYTDAGTITSIGETLTGTSTSRQCFTYDGLQRLTQAWTTTASACQTTPTTTDVGGPEPYWTSWTFDTAGNRTSQTQHDLTGGTDATTSYTYPSPTAAHPHAAQTVTTPTATNTYSYDDAGNTTGRTIEGTAQTLTWDAQGHLASYTSDDQTTSFVYDAEGNRLLRRDPDGTTTAFLGGFELAKAPSGTLTATRYYADVATRTPTGLTWTTNDHHGTAQVAIDATSLAVTLRRQTPYGEPRGSTPAWPNTKGFLGATEDPTGLVHLSAREYDPTLGKFISVDPVMDLTDPQQWNAYAYATDQNLGRLVFLG